MGGISEKVKRAEEIEQKLIEGQVIVELDPALIDNSFVPDRMEATEEQNVAFRELIREHGQNVPILVRPKPNGAERYDAREVAAIDPQVRLSIREAQRIHLADRLDELKAFQGFMDFASTAVNSPAISRAQVIVQNYVCFVYLGESCFRDLRKALPPAPGERAVRT